MNQPFRPAAILLAATTALATFITGCATTGGDDHGGHDHNHGFEGVKQLVASGACIACLSMHALDHAIAQGWLVEVKSRLKPPERKLAIVRHRQRPLRAQAAVFMEACRSMG